MNAAVTMNGHLSVSGFAASAAFIADITSDLLVLVISRIVLDISG
jgi:hypothetical protein